MDFDVLVIALAIKALLFQAYFSTDFDVHRNWLAVTSQLPVSQWYVDSTSEWTLDYPPFFAWFEYLLAWPAGFVAPEALELTSGVVQTVPTVFYQRVTVLLSELVMIYVLARRVKTNRLTLIAIILNFGLVLVDNIHFQYNSILFSILILSYHEIQQGRIVMAGAVFAVLLNFKHLFMYMAPVYFVYMLRHTVFPLKGNMFGKLAGVVVGVFVVSLLPFASGFAQLLSRLFPFKRGLIHAYWAPNFWALY